MKADKAGIQPQSSLAVIPGAGLTPSPAHCLGRWAEGNSLASACWNLSPSLFPDNLGTFQEQSVLSRNHSVINSAMRLNGTSESAKQTRS